MPGASKSNGGRLRGAERRRHAVALRIRGWTCEAIGRELGVSGVQAWRYVREALEAIVAETKDAARELRALELERLDAMLVGLWDAATTGDTQAVGAAIRVAERRAKLLGLDMPSKVEASGPNGAPVQTWCEVFADFTKLSDGELEQLEVIAEKLAPPAAAS